jgi:hypothetical protein
LGSPPPSVEIRALNLSFNASFLTLYIFSSPPIFFFALHFFFAPFFSSPTFFHRSPMFSSFPSTVSFARRQISARRRTKPRSVLLASAIWCLASAWEAPAPAAARRRRQNRTTLSGATRSSPSRPRPWRRCSAIIPPPIGFPLLLSRPPHRRLRHPFTIPSVDPLHPLDGFRATPRGSQAARKLLTRLEPTRVAGC